MDHRWWLAAAVAALAVASGVTYGRGVTTAPLPQSPQSTVVETTSADPGTVVVHVAGWVETPGVVAVAAGARVADAILAAGGVRPGANLDAVNLAQQVSDGQQLVVPGPGKASSDVTGIPDPGASRIVDLNVATAAQLESLPGVGPVLAGRIVAHRLAHGPFETIEDLLEVSGIGESKLAAIRDHVVAP